MIETEMIGQLLGEFAFARTHVSFHHDQFTVLAQPFRYAEIQNLVEPRVVAPFLVGPWCGLVFVVVRDGIFAVDRSLLLLSSHRNRWRRAQNQKRRLAPTDYCRCQ